MRRKSRTPPSSGPRDAHAARVLEVGLVRCVEALWLVLVCLAMLLGSLAVAAPLSPAAERGKQLYTTGTSAFGHPVEARVGAQDIPLPASAVPCASCHGPDGLGRPEAGVLPTDIRWRTLSKPYGAVAAGARRHPPYTAESFAAALRAGTDPGGNQLVATMPRYALGAEDLADLIAYLQRIEADLDPGLGEAHLVIGTVLPRGDAMGGIGPAMGAVIEALFADVNAAGGLYGRELRLRTVSDHTPDALLARGRDWLSGGEDEPFALLAIYTGGHDADLARAAEARGIPLLGTFTAGATEAGAGPPSSFYLFGGLAVQGRALAEHAAATFAPARIAVVHPEGDPAVQPVAEAILTQIARRGEVSSARIGFPRNRIDAPRIAHELRARGIQAAFFLGSGSQYRLLTEAAYALDWEPFVYVLGSLTGNQVFAAPLDFQDRVFMAFPTAASDRTARGTREFNTFHARHRLGRTHLPAQVSVYVATKALVHGLRRAGRELSRRKLIAALESLYEFESGLIPALSFGPNRRIGALGAHVVAVDLRQGRFGGRSEWIVPP